MKKIIVTVIAVLAAAALSSCMGGATGSKNTVDPAVKANEAHSMTVEKAAGTYALEAMDSLGETGKDAYEINELVLNEDGTYAFTVKTSEATVTEEGLYTIGKNGVIKFTGENSFAIVAEGETVVCDGKNLTAEGRLGRMSVITMNYAKVTEEKKAEEEKTVVSEEAKEENSDAEENN